MYAANRRDQAAQAYAQGAATMPPTLLLVQVHDGMVQKLRQVRSAIQDDRIEERVTESLKVANVIEALHLALDTERGGEVAANLAQLYGYFIGRIQALNLQNDPAICDELIARLSELRQGWQGAMHQAAPPATDNLSA